MEREINISELLSGPHVQMRREPVNSVAPRGSAYLMSFDRHGAPFLVRLLSEHGDVNLSWCLVVIYSALSGLYRL